MSTVDEVEREQSEDFEEIEQDEINCEDIKIELDVGDNISLHKSELNGGDDIFSQESERKVADDTPGIEREPRDDIFSQESEMKVAGDTPGIDREPRDDIFSQETEMKVADDTSGIDREPQDDIFSQESELVKQEIKLEYIQGKNLFCNCLTFQTNCVTMYIIKSCFLLFNNLL